MVVTNNSTIVNDALKELNLPVGTGISATLASITPVYPINKKYTDVVTFSTRTTTGSLTVLTTQSGEKDFYLTMVRLSGVIDAAYDSTYIHVTIVVNGLTIPILRYLPLPATAARFQDFVVFPHPIKLDKGSIIQIGSSFTAGTMTLHAVVGGFYL